MKFTIIFLILFSSCEEILDTKKDMELNYCEQARVYIGECINSTLPILESCDEDFAKSVLNQHCDNVVDYIFNK